MITAEAKVDPGWDVDAASPVDAIPGRILVVDDEQTTCELFELALKRHHEVTWRTSGEAALELVAERDFDAVLTDLCMEDISGLDLCERIVGMRPDIPVIVVTGNGTQEAAIGAIRVGAYDFVTKPVDAGLLELTVRRALRHRRLQEEKRLGTGRLVFTANDPAELITAAELERRYIRHVLTLVNGNKSHAARILGFDRRTLYRKAERSGT